MFKEQRLRTGNRLVIGAEGRHMFRFNNPQEVNRQREASCLSTPQETSLHSTTAVTEASVKEADLLNYMAENSPDQSMQTGSNHETATKVSHEETNVIDSDDQRMDEIFAESTPSRKDGETRGIVSALIDLEESKVQTGSVQSSFVNTTEIGPPDERVVQGSGIELRNGTIPSPLATSSRNSQLSNLRSVRKRASATEQLVQALNADRLEAEARGSIRTSSLMDRLLAVQIDAEHQMALSSNTIASDEVDDVRTIQRSGYRKSDVVKSCIKLWRIRQQLVLHEMMLENTSCLKECQLLISYMTDNITIQFAILDADDVVVSPLEDDRIYEHFEEEHISSTKGPNLVVRVADIDRGLIQHWTIKQLHAKCHQLKSTGRRTSTSSSRKVPILNKPTSQYGLIGSTGVSVSVFHGKTEREFLLDVYSPYTTVQIALLKVRCTTSRIADKICDIHLEIESLAGLLRKEVTDVHIHAFFETNREMRLTTPASSVFRDNVITFKSHHSCRMQVSNLPDVISFKVYGAMQPDLLSKLSSWDDLQESVAEKTLVVPKQTISEQTLLAKISIQEMDSNGHYTSCEVVAGTSTVPDFFYLHQGLSRRISFTFKPSHRDSALLLAVRSIEISNVEDKHPGADEINSDHPSDTVRLKLISAGETSSTNFGLNELSSVLAQWDSSMHNSKLLDQTTAVDHLVSVALSMEMQSQGCPNFHLTTVICMRIHGRDEQPGYLSRLLNYGRTTRHVTILYRVPVDYRNVAYMKPDTARDAHCSGLVQDKKLLGSWKPRGDSLIHGYNKMTKDRRLALALQETKSRYSVSQLAPPPPPSQPFAARWDRVGDEERSRDIIAYWQGRTQRSTALDDALDKHARTLSRPSTVASITLEPTVQKSGHLGIRSELPVSLDNVTGARRKTGTAAWVRGFVAVRGHYLVHYASSAMVQIQVVLDLRDSVVTDPDAQETLSVDGRRDHGDDSGGKDGENYRCVFRLTYGRVERDFRATSEEEKKRWMTLIRELATA